MGRSYQKTKTKEFRAGGSITLHYCGGTSVTDPGNGFAGNGYIHPVVGTDRQFHNIEINLGFGPQIKIETKMVDSNAAPGGSSGTSYVTRIIVNAVTIAEWWNDAESSWDRDPVNSNYVLKSEDITVNFTCTLSTIEQADEEWGFPLRPEKPENLQQSLHLKPTAGAKVHTVISIIGMSTFGTGTGQLIFDTTSVVDVITGYLSEVALSVPYNDYAFYIHSEYHEPYFHSMPGDISGINGWDADLPYPNATYAEANNFFYNDVLTWYGEDGNIFYLLNTIPDGSDYGLGKYATGFRFTAIYPNPDPSLNTLGTISVPNEQCYLTGLVKDFNGTIKGVPVNFFRSDTFGELPFNSNSFSGDNRIVQMNGSPYLARLNQSWLVNNGYSPDEVKHPIMRMGNRWSSLTLDKLKTLKVLDFTSGPITWTNTNCTTSIISILLVCTSTGSNPKISRNLKNDLLDMEPDPVTWWATYHSEAGFKEGAYSWYTGQMGGPTLNLNGPGEWVRVGCRLRTGSDLFNWSSFRFAYLTGKADVSCNVTVKVFWNDILFGNNGVTPPTLLKTDRNVSYIVALTDVLSSVEIDLSAMPDDSGVNLVGQTGLRCIYKIEISFPTGRTISLQDIVLKEKQRPVIDIHNGDIAGISASCDGKRCLVFPSYDPADFTYNGYPGSFWGYPIKQKLDGYGSTDNPSSLLMSQLIQELNLQEGWIASNNGGIPDDGSPDFAIWLEDIFNAPPGSFYSRRSYGYLHFYPSSYEHADIECVIGSEVKGLVFDPTTHLPISLPVRGEIAPDGVYGHTLDSIPLGTELSTVVSQSDGRFVQKIKTTIGDGDDGFEERDNYTPITNAQIIYPPPIDTGGGYITQPINIPSRTIWYPTFPGIASTGGIGNPVIDVDYIGNRWVAFIKDGLLTLARWLGTETNWTYFDVGVAALNPWIHNNQIEDTNPVYISFEISGTILMVNSITNGEDNWKMTILATGTNAVIRFNKLHTMLCATYCRGGNVYFKRWSDAGVTSIKDNSGNDEFLVMAAPPAQYSFDWLGDDLKTLFICYSDGTSIKGRISTDNGETFVDA